LNELFASAFADFCGLARKNCTRLLALYAVPVGVSDISIVGKGIYPVPEAARLAKVTPRRIRYWLGRRDSEISKSTQSSGLWFGQHEPIDDKFVLGFLDLQEVRFVDAFLKAGVTWRMLRRAHEMAKRRYGTEHPFCTRRFTTDGSQIIEMARRGSRLEWEETARGQTVFPAVVAPFLKQLEFAEDGGLVRWWPLGNRRRVVLDPGRQFGQPIVPKAGVRTEVLFLAVKAGTSDREVAQWFDVEVEDVPVRGKIEGP